ncbi:Smim8 [Columba guinea]|nr:Smim8 [Columba guinea]
MCLNQDTGTADEHLAKPQPASRGSVCTSHSKVKITVGILKYSTLIKMSSTKPPNESEAPKERKPGLRNVQTTMLFRAVNPELFIKPNKPVMAFGLVAITLCVAYLGYLHATVENKNDLYEAVDSEGSRYMRRKTSKWD